MTTELGPQEFSATGNGNQRPSGLAPYAPRTVRGRGLSGLCMQCTGAGDDGSRCICRVRSVCVLCLYSPVWWVWEGFLVCGVRGSGCMVRYEGGRRFSCLCHRMGSTGRRQRQIIGGPVVDTGLYACRVLGQQPVSRMDHVMFSSIKTPPPPPAVGFVPHGV